jgi:anti-anti-sigma regulatory factor
MNTPLCTATRLADDSILVATIAVGELREPAVAYDLRSEMLSLVKEAGTQHLVIDARNLILIGSVGFLAFLGVRRELKGRIVLCNLTEPIRDSFAVCRLIPGAGGGSAPFEVANTLPEALEAFASSAA